MANVSFIRARLDRYRGTVAWIIRDTLRAAWRRVVVVLLLNSAGVLSATGSMGLVLRYIHWAQQAKPTPFKWAGFTLLERPGVWPVVIVAILALFLGVSSAYLIYAGDRALLHLVRQAQTRFMRSMLQNLRRRRLGTLMLEYERRLGEAPAPMDLLVAGSRYSAFALRSLIQLFLPTMTLLVSLIALVAIDWLMTTVLVVLASLYLLPLYRINESVARHHRQYRRTTRHVPRAIGSSLTVMVGTSGPVRDFSPGSDDDIFERPEFQEMQDGLFGRMLATKRLVLLNSTFLIGFVTLILLAFSREDAIAWTSLLAYLIAVRFTWSSVRQVTALLTNFNQIYIEVERVATFIRLAEERESAAQAPPPFAGIEFANPARHQKTFGAPKRVRIDRGSLVLLLDARTIEGSAMDRALAVLAAKAESGAEHLASATLHDAPRLVPGLTLSQHIFGDRTPSDAEARTLAEILEETGIADQVGSLPEGLATGAGGELPLTRHGRFLIGAAYLLITPPTVVLLNLQSMADVKSSMRQMFFRRLRGSVSMLMDNAVKTWAENDEIRRATTHVVMLLDRGDVVVGDVTWLESRREQVEAELEALAAARRQSDGSDQDDPEEFTDDD